MNSGFLPSKKGKGGQASAEMANCAGRRQQNGPGGLAPPPPHPDPRPSALPAGPVTPSLPELLSGRVSSLVHH